MCSRYSSSQASRLRPPFKFAHQAEELFTNIYLSYVTIRSALSLTLLCWYRQLQRPTDGVPNESEQLSKRATSDWLLAAMENFGVVHRRNGNQGVMFYSVMLSCGICYCVLPLIYNNWNRFRYLTRGFPLYMWNRPLEEQIIVDRIDNIIIQTVNSLISSTKGCFWCSVAPYHNSSAFKTKEIESHDHDYVPSSDLSASKNIVPALSGESKQLSYLTASSASKNYEESHYTKEVLRRKLVHLMRLRKDTKSIWPPNRNVKWREEISRIWFIWYATTSFFMFGLSQSLLLKGHKLALSSLKGQTLSRPMDLFSICDHHFFMFIFAEKFSAQAAKVVVSILDQSKFLADLKKRFNLLIIKMEKFKLIEYDTMFHFAQKPHDYLTMQKLFELERSELDKEALELYLSHTLFVEDLKLTLEILEAAVNQTFLFNVIRLVPSLYLIRRMDMRYVFPNIAGTLVMFTIANINFAYCANLHRACLEMLKLAWSLLAASTPDIATLTIKGNKESVITQSRDFRAKPSRSPLTPHTILPWSRLVEDQERFSNASLVRLFNSLGVDFKGMLKMNFWLVSSLLFSITYLV